MSIVRQIYEDYCEGKLSVKPPEPSARDNLKLTEIEEIFEMSEDDIEYFESAYFELCIENEKRLFYAGFKTALRMISE